MIVDDDPLERMIVEKVLKRNNHEVIAANNGLEAWKHIQDDPVRFVITDWMMAEMDGLALIEKVRQADFPYYIYMILLTAKDNISDIVAGLNTGADDYLTKPFDPLELQARIMVGERILMLEDSLRQTRDQLEHQALHDNLTGLMNRRAIYKYIQLELEKARRAPAPFSIIFLDIDDFKKVNDRFGHMTGDTLLKALADVLRSRCRPYDGLGRWAGDEFIVALPNTTSENAVKVANRILDSAQQVQVVPSGAEDFRFGISAGIATVASIPAADMLLEQLIQCADEALYRAKNAGKNRIETNQLDLAPHG